MATRFRKSIKIAPGVKLNINKKSIGITAGVKGAHVSVNSKGRKTTTVGIPGTGLSYTETSKIGASTDKTSNRNSRVGSNVEGAPPNPPKIEFLKSLIKASAPLKQSFLAFLSVF
ncbi:DUF4236 domain-containing protein [Emergencia timonensis]|uniref:DUF4236 domain-containing protein n=1 Tax=Emergencia timonensis TaxID=1776384 RepID=UPI00295AF8D9|nr:DUF4236 domain-containing protein [Emergencia timonensis]WNX87556.1 DUF4236 domain-containing protein [Emergencia timonensis]